jgi:hypothetical protein
MIRAGSLIRVLAKACVWMLAGLVVLLSIWFAVNRLSDEPLHPAQVVLKTAGDQIPDSQNAAVGILGLSAPAGVDFLAYGARVKGLLLGNGPRAKILDMVEGPGNLHPTVGWDQVNCWLEPGQPLWKGCLPFDQAPMVLGQNAVLLQRLRSLYRLTGFSGLYGSYNQTYIVVLRLSLAEMWLDLRQKNPEIAYQKFREQLLFVKRNLRGPDTWVGKAIGLVAYGMTLPFLEQLLYSAPGLAKTHASELLDMLRPEGADAINPDGIARSEYALLEKMLESPLPLRSEGDKWDWLASHLGQRNRIRNWYSAFLSEYAPALRLSWVDSERELARLRQKYLYPPTRDILVDPFGSGFAARFIYGDVMTGEMVLQAHVIDVRLRLATLMVRLINERISDQDIPRFLAAAGPQLQDPFTGGPMRWAPRDRAIYFSDPKDKCWIGGLFRLPPVDPANGSSVPAVHFRLC